jgi:enolase-phosphatase E1
MKPPAAVVTDIEGTTTRISFVHDVLFPYARARLPDFLAQRGREPEIATVLADVRHLAPDAPELATLLAWMDTDAKITPLKTLQGLIWGEGYESGALHGELYADVAPSLRAWHAAGVRLYAYSSGSEAAQKLLFRHTQEGDLTALFSGFFDTRVGAKRDAPSYRAIAEAADLPGGKMLFLSDVGGELDAAAAAGWRTCQLLRPQDATVPAPGHVQCATFDEVATVFGLSGANA